jgi:acetyltransferase-like isoleucine patch superfamily enzyme
MPQIVAALSHRLYALHKVGQRVRWLARIASIAIAIGQAELIRLVFGWEQVAPFIARCDKHATLGLLHHFGATVGTNADIESGLIVHHADRNFSNLVIGDDSHIGKDVFLDLAAPIKISDKVTISMRATIITHLDVGRSPIRDRFPDTKKAVVIKEGAYVGAGATILQGVTIHQEAVVGAGAVVIHDVEPLTVVTGVPARVSAKNSSRLRD